MNVCGNGDSLPQTSLTQRVLAHLAVVDGIAETEPPLTDLEWDLSEPVDPLATTVVIPTEEAVGLAVDRAEGEDSSSGGAGLVATTRGYAATNRETSRKIGEAIARGVPKDKLLVRYFEELVRGIDFAEVAVPSGDRPITKVEQFRFVPVVSPNTERSSSDTAGYGVRTEDGVRMTYPDGHGGKPYLDAGQAVGLVYGDSLIAVAAAGIAGDRYPLTIVQIQDVTGVRKETDRKAYFRTGLHNGILWRDTLIRAWEVIATQIRAETISVQSNINNPWAKVKAAGGRGYDDVAERMGYQRSDEQANWVKTLELPELQVEEEATIQRLGRLALSSMF